MANHDYERRVRKVDPFLLNYTAADLKIAAEFLSNWIPFLTRGLCRHCTRTLSDRVRSLDTESQVTGSLKQEDTCPPSSTNMAVNRSAENHDDCDTNSLGSWKGTRNLNDTADTNSIGSWKDSADGCSQLSIDTDLKVAMRKNPSIGSGSAKSPMERRIPWADMEGSAKSPMERIPWADMAEEDELGEEDEVNGNGTEETNALIKPKLQLSRVQRELIRFNNVQRKKDFVCLEHVNGKIVNILDGLELHAGVFSAAEQKRIIQYVEELREMGQNGQLKKRTYTAPQKWMKGKGRVTIQFGCCYNYAMDKKGNPPGILKNELVDPIPHLLKVMIKRMVSWHVLPPTCIPDSCIVNIYEEGDCIPPHIDNREFVRPFCTVSFLSECNIVFGSNLKIIGPGEFTGAYAIPLPVGSVLVLKGNGADVAKHCVPAVPTKRISITFRRMDESKRPNGYVPEPDLEGLEPMSFEANTLKDSNSPEPSVRSAMKQPLKRQVREESSTPKGRAGYANGSSESRQYPNGISESRQYPNGISESRQYPNGISESRQYPNGSSESRQYTNGSSESRQYTNGSSGSRQYTNGSSESRQYSRVQQQRPVNWRRT